MPSYDWNAYKQFKILSHTGSESLRTSFWGMCHINKCTSDFWHTTIQHHHFLVFVLCLKLKITISFSGPLSTLLLFSGSVVSDSFATPGTIAHQAPLSMGFSRHEYRNGVPFPSPGYLIDPGIDPHLLHCRRILYH